MENSSPRQRRANEDVTYLEWDTIMNRHKIPAIVHIPLQEKYDSPPSRHQVQ
jgi:hypothetical protein